MNYWGKGTGGALATTGTLTIGGLALEQFGLLAASMVLVGAAAVAVRFGFRRGKEVGEQ